MIQARDLRIGNLVIWNPKLSNPHITLPPFHIEVFSVLPDKISYVFPNIENRVEPFEDEIAQMGERYKRLEELEPIELTAEMLCNGGFIEKCALSQVKYYEKGDLQLKHTGGYFKRISVNASDTSEYDLPIKYFHQLQNLFFALSGEELESKLHGQQS